MGLFFLLDFVFQTFHIIKEGLICIFSNEVLPEVEVFFDGVASNLTGNETIKDDNSYNIGRYNGCIEIVNYVMKELGWSIEIAIDADGKHMIIPVENES